MASLSAAASDLAALRWEKRPVLVFTESAQSPLTRQQLATLKSAAAGLADRRIAVYIVEPDRVVHRFGAPPLALDPAALRSRYGERGDPFRLVLVGLDGGAKLSSNAPVDVDALFSRIDGMPMRRQELRARGDQG